MKRILVTGGTGTLGRHVVADLTAAGHDVAVLSRRPAPASPPASWFTGDLRTGVGVDAALDGIDTVVHCATGRGDRTAAGRLITTATRTGRPHIVYISIVGVDVIPFGYYQTKLEVERRLMASSLPWTTLRATQFHSLIASIARKVSVPPVAVVPRGLSFQPIAAAEVATRLADLAAGEAVGRVDDMGGPEVHPVAALVRTYIRAIGRRRAIVAAPVPGKIFKAFRDGGNLTPEHAVGRQTFEEYLVEGR